MKWRRMLERDVFQRTTDGTELPASYISNKILETNANLLPDTEEGWDAWFDTEATRIIEQLKGQEGGHDDER